jgi:hypothetical protein
LDHNIDNRKGGKPGSDSGAMTAPLGRALNESSVLDQARLFAMISAALQRKPTDDELGIGGSAVTISHKSMVFFSVYKLHREGLLRMDICG